MEVRPQWSVWRHTGEGSVDCGILHGEVLGGDLNVVWGIVGANAPTEAKEISSRTAIERYVIKSFTCSIAHMMQVQYACFVVQRVLSCIWG